MRIPTEVLMTTGRVQKEVLRKELTKSNFLSPMGV